MPSSQGTLHARSSKGALLLVCIFLLFPYVSANASCGDKDGLGGGSITDADCQFASGVALRFVAKATATNEVCTGNGGGSCDVSGTGAADFARCCIAEDAFGCDVVARQLPVQVYRAGGAANPFNVETLDLASSAGTYTNLYAWPNEGVPAIDNGQ